MTKFLDDDSDDHGPSSEEQSIVNVEGTPVIRHDRSEVGQMNHSLGADAIEDEESRAGALNLTNKSMVNTKGLKSKGGREMSQLAPIEFKDQSVKSLLGRFLVSFIIITSVIEIVALIMFLFNGQLVYENFWFSIVFSLLLILICLAEFPIKGFEEWGHENFRFILRKIAAPVFHGIIILIYPYNLNSTVLIMKIASILALITLGTLVIETLLYIFWELKGH